MKDNLAGDRGPPLSSRNESGKVPRVAIALLLIDGVLGVLLVMRLATIESARTPSAVAFAGFLLLGGIAGVGLLRRKAIASWIGLVSSCGTVGLAVFALWSLSFTNESSAALRYGLRLLTGTYVVYQLLVHTRPTAGEAFR